MYIHAIRLAALGRGSVVTPFELCTSLALGVGAGELVYFAIGPAAILLMFRVSGDDNLC